MSSTLNLAAEFAEIAENPIWLCELCALRG
jgi:hypothetical protein